MTSKLVPVEPTMAMISAAQVESNNLRTGDWSRNDQFIAVYKAMLAAAPSEPAEPVAESAEMLRCLGFALAMKEVKDWPVWVCSGAAISEAENKGWLKQIRLEPFIPREGKSFRVLGPTPAGINEYYRLLASPQPVTITHSKSELKRLVAQGAPNPVLADPECKLPAGHIGKCSVEHGVPQYMPGTIAASPSQGDDSPAYPILSEADVAGIKSFYSVDTDRELIDAQAHHIEKLQAKLPATRDFETRNIREG